MNAPNNSTLSDARVQFIDSSDVLHKVCARLAGRQRIAVDTEFVRERTYYPQLCLIQVADETDIYCFDVLAFDDLTPLIDVFCHEEIVKVLHAARQDFEALLHVSGRVPTNLVDTQIAAGLCGCGDQVSYATLVDDLCDVQLAKTQTRTDWSRRPLSAKQIRYAADDVRYLLRIHEILTDRLNKLGRFEWLTAESHALTDPALYVPNPDQAWRRIKASGRLDSRHTQALRNLAAWRELTAAKRDKPRRWIVDDRTLVEIASRQPANELELRAVLGPDNARLNADADTIIAAVQDTNHVAIEATRDRPDAQQNQQITDLMRVVKHKADEHGLSAALLTTRREIKKLVFGQRDLAVLRGWRRELVGTALLERLGALE